MTRYGWAVATTEAGLATGSFFARRLPLKFDWEYKDFSASNAKGDGGQSRHGNKYIRFTFREMTRHQAATLQDLIQTALDAGTDLHLVIDRANAENAGRDWIDVQGVPWKLDVTPARNSSESQIGIYNNVEFFVNALQINNEPSSYV